MIWYNTVTRQFVDLSEPGWMKVSDDAAAALRLKKTKGRK